MANRKLPECTKNYQKIAIKSAELFQNAIGASEYFFNFSRQLQRMAGSNFLKKAKHRKGDRVLIKVYNKARNSKNDTDDPATLFRSHKFKEFCKEWHIRNIECPKGDHRGNGKIERLIRTINKRQRTNKQIIVTNDKTGLSEILFALRMNPSATKKSPFERHTGQEPNTIKRIITNHKQVISDNQEVNINNDDFESG